MSRFTCVDVASASQLEVGPRVGQEQTYRCPRHADTHPSLYVNPTKDKWMCGPCGAHGGAFALAAFLAGHDPTDKASVCEWLRAHGLLNGNGQAALGPVVASYRYRTADGTLAFVIDRYADKTFRVRRPCGNGWIRGSKGAPRVPYALERLASAPDLFIPEGERDVDALWAIGIPATTNPFGARRWQDAYTELLVSAGVRRAYILRDQDEPGYAHGTIVALSLHRAGVEVRVPTVPGLHDAPIAPAHGRDVSDWLQDGHTSDELWAIAKAAPVWTPGEREQPAVAPASVTDGQTATPVSRAAGRTAPSQATVIVRLALEAGAELWHTPGGDAYVTVLINKHHEHHALTSRAVVDHLARLYYRYTGTAANDSALHDARATLSGIAQFDGTVHEVHVRVAGDERHIYIDLGDPAWRAIAITEGGWEIVWHPPVRFRRPRGLLALPDPVRGGTIEELQRFVNVKLDGYEGTVSDEFVLVVAWILAAMRPRGPYPIAVLVAEQGSSKTTTSRVCRRLVDPNESDVRRPPRNTEDLMIAATNSYVVAFDNLSRLSEQLADTLSSLATGAGFTTRRLYTNNEEHLFRAARPIILNVIAQVATRGDLLDRAVVITLPPISGKRRQDEATFWRHFDEAHPRLLGAFLDALVTGLGRVEHLDLPHKPRMADFALWSVATEPACPWQKDRFMAVYTGNRTTAVADLLEGDQLAEFITVLAERGGWQGTASELLGRLEDWAPEHVRQRKDWYKNPRQLSDHLRRLAPALRQVGIDVTFEPRTSASRPITVSSSKANPARSSASSASSRPDS